MAPVDDWSPKDCGQQPLGAQMLAADDGDVGDGVVAQLGSRKSLAGGETLVPSIPSISGEASGFTIRKSNMAGWKIPYE